MNYKAEAPLITCVIPVFNGMPYIIDAVESFFDQGSSFIELIVSDNHSTDGTREYLKTVRKKNIKIISPSKKLTMSEHYEFALTHVNGEWIQFLGADDALMPYYAEKLLKILQNEKIIDIFTWNRAYFYWPNSNQGNNEAVVNFNYQEYFEIRNIKQDFFRAFLGSKSMFDIPQIYTGSIVRRNLISYEFQKNNLKFYNSIIPDIYSSVVLSQRANEYGYLYTPLTWVGTSKSSMSLNGRIYNEQSTDESLNSWVKVNLHALGYKSIYILECLRGFRANKQELLDYVLAFLAYSACFIEIITNRKSTSNQLKIWWKSFSGPYSPATQVLCILVSPGILVYKLISWFIEKGERFRRKYLINTKRIQIVKYHGVDKISMASDLIRLELRNNGIQ